MNEVKIVVFSLNNEICGVDATQVEELIKYENLVYLEHKPDYIDGVINNRDTILPIVNLNKKFNLGDSLITKKSKVIVSKVKDTLIGYAVNEVIGLQILKEDEMENVPHIIHKEGREYIKYVGKKNNEIISIIDFYDLINNLEYEELIIVKDLVNA